MYVGPGQANSERDILSNRYGSARYAAFLNGKPLNEFGELNGVQGQTSEVITQHIFMMKEHKRLSFIYSPGYLLVQLCCLHLYLMVDSLRDPLWECQSSPCL